LPLLAPMAFVLATLMLFWARWPHTGQIMLLLILPLPVYLYYQAKGNWRDFGRQLRASWWLFAYLIVGSAQRMAYACGDRRRERCRRNGGGEVLKLPQPKPAATPCPQLVLRADRLNAWDGP
jgi:hypothetical protein